MSATKSKQTRPLDKDRTIVSTLFALGLTLLIALIYNAWDILVVIFRALGW